MRLDNFRAIGAWGGLVAACAIAIAGPAAAFTEEQAAQGKAVYDPQCGQCHGFQLEGPEAPGLVGADVMSTWGTPQGLYDFISVAMPPSAPGKLGEQDYVDVIAYIMQFNGAQPDDTALAMGPDMETISLASVTAAGPAGGGATAAGPVDTTPVPQAYTWGKELPGGLAPEAMQTASPGADTSVPQAYTWGKELPAAN